MVAFASVEEMQAHYRAVKARIEVGRPKFRKLPVEAAPAVALPLPPQPDPELPPLPENSGLASHWDVNGNPVREKKAVKPVEIIEEAPVQLPKIWLQELTDLVCEHTGITQKLIWCPRRTQEIVKARFLIWALAREFCHQHSLPTIGRFCGRDHTTILHGCREGRKLPAYPELARTVQAILDKRAGEPKS
jgi:hypothetical protein